MFTRLYFKPKFQTGVIDMTTEMSNQIHVELEICIVVLCNQTGVVASIK